MKEWKLNALLFTYTLFGVLMLNVLTSFEIFGQAHGIDSLNKPIELHEGNTELSVNTLSIQRDSLKQLSNQFMLKGDYRQSFYYYKKYVEVKDSIMSTENIKSINNLQIKFETEKKEQQIALLNTDKKIQEKAISKKKTQRNGFIAGSVFLLMIGGVTYNRYQDKKRANKQLSDALNQLKLLQENLIAQEKLASLGQLTAGIAHEIQNPLNFVINFSQLSVHLFNDLKETTNLKEQHEILADLEDNINKIERHGQRAHEIIQSMLLHSRSTDLERHIVDFNALCNTAVNYSWHAVAIRHPHFKCKLILEFEEKLPEIWLVPHEVSRVIINLLNNAFYTVQEKEVNNMHESGYEPQVSVKTSLIENYLQLKISDNGCGIPEEIRSKIFQPFYTTKPTNLGTGLGLSISYDIARMHDGSLVLESTSTYGSVFVLTLPV